MKDRIKEVLKLSDWILGHDDHIMDRLIEETGKADFDAFTSEIFAVLDSIDYYKGHAKKILADKKVHTPIFQLGKKSRIYYEPLGTYWSSRLGTILSSKESSPAS